MHDHAAGGGVAAGGARHSGGLAARPWFGRELPGCRDEQRGPVAVAAVLREPVAPAALVERPLASVCVWLSRPTQQLAERRLVLPLHPRPDGGGRALTAATRQAAVTQRLPGRAPAGGPALR